MRGKKRSGGGKKRGAPRLFLQLGGGHKGQCRSKQKGERARQGKGRGSEEEITVKGGNTSLELPSAGKDRTS